MADDRTTPDQTALITLLDAVDALPAAVRIRQRTYDLLDPRPADAVVDVGCGTGRAVAGLNDRGAHGIGVDPDATMLSAARRRWPGADLRSGTAQRLPLEDAGVAGYRADKVFHAVADLAQALDEARRVLRPGGRIVLLGQDWDAIMIDSDRPELTRTIVRAQADAFPHPRAARRYRNLLLDAGFAGVGVEAHTAIFTDAAMLRILEGFAGSALASGALAPEEFSAWTAEQHHRAGQGRLFFAIPFFLAWAQRR